MGRFLISGLPRRGVVDRIAGNREASHFFPPALCGRGVHLVRSRPPKTVVVRSRRGLIREAGGQVLDLVAEPACVRALVGGWTAGSRLRVVRIRSSQ